MNQVTWSRLETGKRAPTSEELALLCQKFQLGQVFARPKNALLQLRQNSATLNHADKVFVTPRDRSSHIRFRAAQKSWPSLTKRLKSFIRVRPDYPLIQHACHQISFDSALETLYVQCLLADGAVASVESPYLQGHLPHPVIDPRNHREVGQLLHYCFKWNSGLYFFQVTFKTLPTCRVDVLIRRNQRWEVLEINGAGHDSSKDETRAALLGLPVRNLNRWELEKHAWSVTRRPAA